MKYRMVEVDKNICKCKQCMFLNSFCYSLRKNETIPECDWKLRKDKKNYIFKRK